MPKKPKISSEQRQAVAKWLVRNKSPETIKEKTGLSLSSIARIKAEYGALLEKRTKSKQDLRIRRRMRYLGLGTQPFSDDAQIALIARMAATSEKAAELLLWIQNIDDSIREGRDRNAKRASAKSAKVPKKWRQDFMEGIAAGMFTSQELKKLTKPDNEKAARINPVKPRR